MSDSFATPWTLFSLSGSSVCGISQAKILKVKEAQSCLTICDPMDYTVHGILQARILEWVSFPSSRGSSQPRDQTQVSHIASGFFSSWATGKPKNTEVGCHFLFQTIEINAYMFWLLKRKAFVYQYIFQEEGRNFWVANKTDNEYTLCI